MLCLYVCLFHVLCVPAFSVTSSVLPLQVNAAQKGTQFCHFYVPLGSKCVCDCVCVCVCVCVCLEGMEAAVAGGADLTRKFVSEAELDEARKKRQEEWEQVRKPDDPEGTHTHVHTHTSTHKDTRMHTDTRTHTHTHAHTKLCLIVCVTVHIAYHQ